MAFNTTVAIAERYITSPDGTSVFAQAVGNSHLPTLVFVHGLAMSALVWANILKDMDLLRFFHLVAYDMRGHGRSGKPDALEAYSSERYAQDFGAVLKAFEVTSPPILVGWSLGATIATDVTAYYGPDALAGIVFTGALPWLSAGAVVASEFSRGLNLANTEDASRALEDRIAFTTNLFNHPEKVPAEVLWSWIGGSCLQPPAKFHFVMARAQNETNITNAGAKGVPLLLIHGDADRFVDGKKVREVVGDRFKDLTVRTVSNGSHAFFYEEQKEYVRELSKFAKRVFANGSK